MRPNCPGVLPNHRCIDRFIWAWSAKPAATAHSASGNWACNINRAVRRARASACQKRGGRPVSVTIRRRKLRGDSPSCRACSGRGLSSSARQAKASAAAAERLAPSRMRGSSQSISRSPATARRVDTWRGSRTPGRRRTPESVRPRSRVKDCVSLARGNHRICGRKPGWWRKMKSWQPSGIMVATVASVRVTDQRSAISAFDMNTG